MIASRAALPTTILTTSRSRGAQRDAHADLLRPLRHGVGHHAVDAEDRQRDCDTREDRQQQRLQSRLRDGVPIACSIVRTLTSG